MGEELEALSPESQTGQDPDVSQGDQPDVQTGPSTDEGYFGDGQVEDEGQGQGDDADVDESGVPWKNRAKEYERKLAALEAKGKQSDNLPPKEPVLPPVGTKIADADVQTPEIPDTPAEYAEYVKAEARKEAITATRETFRQQKIQDLVISKYPDILNPDTPFHKWAAHYLREDYGNDSRYLKEAAMCAAEELGVLPASRSNSQNSQRQQGPLPRNQGPLPSTEKGTTVSSAKGDTSILTPVEIQTAKRLGQDLKKLAAFKRREFL